MYLLKKKLQSIWPLAGLLLLALTLRLLEVRFLQFPFMFDHARDALAVLKMVETGQPTLIGPRASIEGLFFGPGWYYLIAPAYWFSGHPLGPVLMMIGLSLIAIALLYKYFGWQAALIGATTTTWIWTATSAWNPFPLVFTSLLLLIVIKKVGTDHRITVHRAGAVGLSIGLGFHFSSAYAIFYPLILMTIWALYWRKTQLSWGRWVWLVGIGCLALTFAPQALFELRHNFGEVRSVAHYILEGGTETRSWLSRLSVGEQVSGTLLRGVLPSFPQLPPMITRFIDYGILIGLATIAWRHRSVLKKNPLSGSCAVFILLPTIGYLVLHFSLWYVLGMLPAATVVAAVLIQQAQLRTQLIWASLYIMAALGVIFSAVTGTPQLTKISLAAKLQAIELVRTKAAGRPFSSYHYAPDVYDYPYQYLYFWQAREGRPLPVEFSYQPNVTPYYPEKVSLLEKYTQQLPTQGTSPELVFFIVEQPLAPYLLEDWWRQQVPITTQGQQSITPDLTVYWGVPSTSSQ